MPEQKDIYNILIDLSDTIKNTAHSLDSLYTEEENKNSAIEELIEHIKEELAKVIDSRQ